jgi:hypothetical protein
LSRLKPVLQQQNSLSNEYNGTSASEFKVLDAYNRMMPWEYLLGRLFDVQPVRRLAETVISGWARRRLAEMDHESIGRSQFRTLMGLVHQGQSTPYGREHDFRRIRTVSDFQRLVPLRTQAQFQQEPISRSMARGVRAAIQESALMSLGILLRARPGFRFLSKSLWLLDERHEDSVVTAANSVDYQKLWRAGLPAILHLSSLGPPDGSDEFQEPPGKEAIVVSAVPISTPQRERLARLFPLSKILVCEGWLRPEGMLAIEDPECGRLRLLPNRGVFFEFIPPDTLDAPFPVRLTIGEVETQASYAAALSSVAGTWATLSDTLVSFDCLEPPLIRRIEKPLTRERSAKPMPRLASAPQPFQPPHIRSGRPADDAAQVPVRPRDNSSRW